MGAGKASTMPLTTEPPASSAINCAARAAAHACPSESTPRSNRYDASVCNPRALAVRRMVDWPDSWIAACALHAARHRRMTGFEQMAERAAAATDAILREEALAYRQAQEGAA